MKAAGFRGVELNFSKEEIDEIAKLQREYEKRKEKERKLANMERKRKLEVKEQA